LAAWHNILPFSSCLHDPLHILWREEFRNRHRPSLNLGGGSAVLLVEDLIIESADQGFVGFVRHGSTSCEENKRDRAVEGGS
jgi:hypothetical protein